MGEPSFLRDTRTAYDAVAPAYAELARTDLATMPFDRAMLTAFAELILTAGGARVADVGCGPGYESAYLHGAGLNVLGLDLSGTMIGQARTLQPWLPIGQASMTSLPLQSGVLSGLLAWYSTIHVPIDHLPGVFTEFHRVLQPGGYALLAFQIGDEELAVQQAYGQSVSVVAYRRSLELIADLLETASLPCVLRAVRQPDPDEKAPKGYLLARKGESKPS